MKAKLLASDVQGGVQGALQSSVPMCIQACGKAWV
ncbi:hypothetical protein M2361_003636 [Achromobacter sp. JUb104]|nr:hypothetical protein [Achromobacter sp. JUb104]